MPASSFSPARCDPRDLIQLLAPGQIIGLLEGNRWIDWSGPSGPDLAILTPATSLPLDRINRNGFHLVLDTDTSSCALGSLLECLAHKSRGVAIVSSRLGMLLRFASRIAAAPVYPQRTSGPFRPRSSGATLAFRETTLRIVESAQVLDSAMLSIEGPDPARAATALAPGFPDIQIDRAAVHVALGRAPAEEVLACLREAGIAVSASRVWYRHLQAGPRDFPHLPRSLLEA